MTISMYLAANVRQLLLKAAPYQSEGKQHVESDLGPASRHSEAGTSVGGPDDGAFGADGPGLRNVLMKRADMQAMAEHLPPSIFARFDAST